MLVVAGHLAMAVVDRDPSGALRGDNVLALHPVLAPLGLLAPMPIFFAAAGWAHGGAGTRHGDTRRRIATQPLWFLAAYVPFVASSGLLVRAATRIGLVLASLATVVALGDILQHAFGAPRAVGFPGFFLVWGTPWLLGAWWRNRADDPKFDERRTGALFSLVGLVACFVLVRWAGYSPSLIDAVPGRRTNTTPPGLFTLAASLAQVGILMIVARPLDAFARRHARRVRQLSPLSVGIYAWHLTAFALCAAAIAVGLPAPGRFGPAWWLTRPVWFAAIIAVTLALSLATGRFTTRLTAGNPAGPISTWIAVFLATCGAALTGLYGPRSIPMALAIIACLATSSVLLRTRH